jgi:hypothetical protein
MKKWGDASNISLTCQRLSLKIQILEKIQLFFIAFW